MKGTKKKRQGQNNLKISCFQKEFGFLKKFFFFFQTKFLSKKDLQRKKERKKKDSQKELLQSSFSINLCVHLLEQRSLSQFKRTKIKEKEKKNIKKHGG